MGPAVHPVMPTTTKLTNQEKQQLAELYSAGP